MDEKRKIYCFLGIPASGKGTQAELLAEKIGAKIYGMGDLIRAELKDADVSDPFYREMQERYEKGIPQPDEIASDIVKKYITKTGGSIIFDNFPFSAKQTELLFEICKNLNVENPKLVMIDLSDQSALDRVLNRKICSSCGKVYIGKEAGNICEKCGSALISRSDDNAEIAEKRIKLYRPRMEEVANIFKAKGLLIEINGEKTIPEVEKEVEKKVINVSA